MKNNELEFLKKKYGENFAKLCRNLFPTILEKDGELSRIITENFAESKSLYKDINSNYLEDKFKSFVYEKFHSEKKQEEKSVEDPFVLMKKAGYTLYKCETNEDVQSFKKYWKESEALCTFRDVNRIEKNLIFFAVKDNVDQIKRENIVNARRQDDYGTSVISLQFTKTYPNTLSIKNRYNHTVENPDATFSNDLENIIAGLTSSFIQKYNLDLYTTTSGFELPGYVLGNDKKFYKYNYEINNAYYCENNIIIDEERNVHQYDKNKFLVLDYFILDLENNQVVTFDNNLDDGFVTSLKDIQKTQIRKEKNYKVIEITPNIGETIRITIDSTNKIIEYENNNLSQVGNNFLFYNKDLSEIVAQNLQQIENGFLFNNSALHKLDAPNLQRVGNGFLKNNRYLQEFNAPNLQYVGDSFLCWNNALTKLNLPSLEHAGTEFLVWNSVLSELETPKLKQIGDDFLRSNMVLCTLDVQNVKQIGNGFLKNNQSLSKLFLPNLETVGNDFLEKNDVLSELAAPNLEKIGNDFLFYNKSLTKLDVLKLKQIGNGFLHSNQVLSEFAAPNLEKIGNDFLYRNKALTELELIHLKQVGNSFLDMNSALTKLNAPNLKQVGDYFLSYNSSLTTFKTPNLEQVGTGFLRSHENRNRVLSILENNQKTM